MILEVCVDSIESMEVAKKAGANRVELCGALNIGGVTPSYGVLKQAKLIKGVEVFVMIRPRAGDFLYTKQEIETMKSDIDMVKEIGFDGIVTGVLRSDGRIDLKSMKELVEYALPLKTVLHRAFDDAKEPHLDIEELINMGICRILTSGQRKHALEGVDYIADIQRTYGEQITIMPGSGVNAGNIEEIHHKTGCTHFHMSGKEVMASKMEYKGYIELMETPKAELIIECTNYDKVVAARNVLDTLK